MTNNRTARPQSPPAAAHEDQRDRAARLRDTAGRFAKNREAEAPSPEPIALPTPQEAPSRGTVPVSADAPEGTYALEITGRGLGLHADPGAAIIVAPEMPTGAGLAVFYLKDKPGPVVFDLTHHFQPEFARPFKTGSGVMPLIEVVEPATGRVGSLSAASVEKIHRAIGIYSDVDLPSKYGPRPPKLPLMSECPEGMGEHYADDAGAYPMVRNGETVVYDPAQRELTHGALCVMQWNNGVRGVTLTNLRPVGGMGEHRWWVDPVNRVGDRTVYASDGPYDADHLRERIVGTVVGVLVPRRVDGPMREAESEAPEAARAETADEIYAAAEPQREAAEAAALSDTGLTSAVSPDLRAAIVRHGEIMKETQLRDNDTDAEFDRDAGMQMEAEYAVAHAPVRTLADLRAKLTYLVPIIVADLADHTHGGHLIAMRDDADRLCRQTPPAADAADPVLAAIQTHSEARAAFTASCNLADEVWRQGHGLDSSDAAMAPARATWEAAGISDVEAWNAVFQTRPTTLAGLVGVIQHAQRWAPEMDGVHGATALGDIFGIVAANAERLTLSLPTHNSASVRSDLATACIQQAERLTAWDATPGSLSEAEGDAEMDRSCAVFKRAITEPSGTLRTIAGKAVLMMDDLDRFYPVERHSTDNFLLMRAILREIITQGTTSDIATISFNAKGL